MNDPVPPERRRLYLIRHAEVSYFSEAGTPLDPRYVTLTERGRQQAIEIAAALADVPLTAPSVPGCRAPARPQSRFWPDAR